MGCELMKCYITGVAGFLGSHLADCLLVQGHEVGGCDNFLTGEIGNVPDQLLPRGFSGMPFLDGRPLSLHAPQNIENLTPERLEGFDVVYHLAAAAYEGVSSFSPAFISRNIYAGSATVFSAAIAAGVKRIVFCSSMARYGDQAQVFMLKHGSFNENLIPDPVDPYGIAKEAAERLLINLCETHGVEWSIAVPHNIYGPRQAIDPYRNVATIFANRMLLGKQPIIYGDGHQRRCFSYVDDVVPSLARMGLDPAARGETVNLGPDQGEVTILELARLVADAVGFDCDPIFLPPRPREVKVALCSATKARRLLGFEQRVELRDGLAKLVEWLRAKGPKEFRYHLPIEIDSPLTPKTWTQRII
jgi:UDP-glucose 4-epimerase